MTVQIAKHTKTSHFYGTAVFAVVSKTKTPENLENGGHVNAVSSRSSKKFRTSSVLYHKTKNSFQVKFCKHYF